MTRRNNLIILMYLSLLMSLFGCFRKKEEKKADLQTWLSENFSGEYVVADRILNLDPKNLYYRKSTSVIARKDDPEVQIVIDWYRDQPDLGLDTAMIRTGMQRSMEDMGKARAAVSSLKNLGIDNVSVAVVTPAIYFLPFAEPVPAYRNKLLTDILKMLASNPDTSLTSVWIEFMEDSVRGKEFKDVVPNGYWHRMDGFHEQHKIMSLDFEMNEDLNEEALAEGWKINPTSRRSARYVDQAYRSALQWAEKNLPQPFYLEPYQMVELNLDEEDLQSIHFHFPYFDQKPPEDSISEENIKGYVSGVYDTDQRSFQKIKKVKELY